MRPVLVHINMPTLKETCSGPCAWLFRSEHARRKCCRCYCTCLLQADVLDKMLQVGADNSSSGKPETAFASWAQSWMASDLLPSATACLLVISATVALCLVNTVTVWLFSRWTASGLKQTVTHHARLLSQLQTLHASLSIRYTGRILCTA